MSGQKFRKQSSKQQKNKKHFRQAHQNRAIESTALKQKTGYINQEASPSLFSLAGLASKLGLYPPVSTPKVLNKKTDILVQEIAESFNEVEINLPDIVPTATGFSFNGFSISLNSLTSVLKDKLSFVAAFAMVIKAKADQFTPYYFNISDGTSNTTYLLDVNKNFFPTISPERQFANCGGIATSIVDEGLNLLHVLNTDMGAPGFSHQIEAELLYSSSLVIPGIPTTKEQCLISQMNASQLPSNAVTEGVKIAFICVGAIILASIIGTIIGCVVSAKYKKQINEVSKKNESIPLINMGSNQAKYTP